MHLLVRRYKRDKDKAALYIFVNADGVELQYIYAEKEHGKPEVTSSMDARQAADKLTHKLGLGGYMPDGGEEVLDLWGPSSTEELGDAPAGAAVDPFESSVGSDFRTAPEHISLSPEDLGEEDED
jgi:hypothetical protein